MWVKCLIFADVNKKKKGKRTMTTTYNAHGMMVKAVTENVGDNRIHVTLYRAGNGDRLTQGYSEGTEEEYHRMLREEHGGTTEAE